ncbi:MAG TPA: nucleoside-diphosphate kinase [Dehalococcoidia bacterium]|nr:nucleoside-diphosphate kinase [Dehalococcoidia bacterium]
MPETERTLVLVKPDALQRGLAGEVLARLERRGLRIAGLKLLVVSDEMAKRHYAEHEGKPFYQGLVSFITSGPIIAAAFEGPGAIQAARQVMGATDPQRAAPGTIRADLGIDMGRNLVHGSDSPESAKRELEIFFTPDELLDYGRAIDAWLVE